MITSSSAQGVSLRQHIGQNRRGVINSLALVLVSVALGTILPWALFFGGEYVRALNPIYGFFSISAPSPIVLLFPTAMAGVTAACLGIEAFCVGYAESSLYQIIDGGSASIRNDMFYFFLRVTGLASLLVFIMTLGTSLHFEALTSMGTNFRILADMNPALQFIGLALVVTFCNYWTHRALHSKWLFEIHKVHHSAQQLGVLLPFRAHPLDHFIAKIYIAASLSLLGITPIVLMTWMGLNAFYQCMVHTKVDWPDWAEWFVVTPALHRIHHSTDPRHFNKNLSILTIWDRLFGTYHRAESVTGYGLCEQDQRHFNTDNYLTEVFMCFARWLGMARS